ncbi:MAG: acetyl-CoA carboxylase biotin carboxyl carrier protein [Clostridia bacterium]
MNINEVKALAEIMTQHSLSLIDIEENGLKIKLEKNITTAVASAPVTIPQVNQEPEETVAPIEEGRVIVSPTVGVYYSSSSPDAAPYVSIGTSISKGDTVCIIEAMKLMNEITADCDGEVVEIMVGNGQVVEYGQPLFRIK